MKYKELLNIFRDRYPFAKYEDYRPICHKLFTDGKVGITLFFENGDIIEYYPAIAEETEQEPEPLPYNHPHCSEEGYKHLACTYPVCDMSCPIQQAKMKNELEQIGLK